MEWKVPGRGLHEFDVELKEEEEEEGTLSTKDMNLSHCSHL